MINFKNQAEENTNTTGTEESIGKAEILCSVVKTVTF